MPFLAPLMTLMDDGWRDERYEVLVRYGATRKAPIISPHYVSSTLSEYPKLISVTGRR